MTQQPNKGKQSLKKYLVFTIMTAVFAGCMWLIFAPKGSGNDAGKEGIGMNANLPDPRGTGITDDKKKAYEEESLRERQEERMKSMQDYSSMFGLDENSEEYQRQVRMAPVPPDYEEQLNASREYSSSAYSNRRGNNFEASGSAYADLTNTLGSFYEEPKEDPEKEQLRKENEQLRKQAEAQNPKSPLDDPMVLLEKSFELAAKYNPANKPVEPESEPLPQSGRKIKIAAVTQVTRNVVTSLDQPMSDSEFLQQYSRERNYGFNTVAAVEHNADKNTISAVVHGTQVLTDGQSVRLRTTEDMLSGRQIIPRNTIITGEARITGERLEITVSSIEYEGKIIPVEMSAYDSDGQRGIYIPGSTEIAAVKEIAGNIGQNLGTTINLNQQSAGDQLLTDLGRGAIQGTSQYIAKKAREIKVTVKAGYRILLLPSDNF